MANAYNKFGRLIQVKSATSFGEQAKLGNLVFGHWKEGEGASAKKSIKLVLTV